MRRYLPAPAYSAYALMKVFGSVIVWALKDVFQRKLQDARITRREDLAERWAGKNHGRIAQIHEVRDVKCLGSKFDRLLLADLECPRQAHIDSNTLRAANITGAHSAVRAG